VASSGGNNRHFRTKKSEGALLSKVVAGDQFLKGFVAIQEWSGVAGSCKHSRKANIS